MGAPVYPIAIVPWAVEANYPAGPLSYNGTPTKVLPVGDVLIPKTKPPAQVVNYLFASYASALQALQSYTLQVTLSLSASNWAPAFPSASGLTGQENFLGANFAGGACYGPLSRKWLISAFNNSNSPFPTYAFYESFGLDAGNSFAGAGANWTQVGPTISPGTINTNTLLLAVCEDPSTPDWWWYAIVEDFGDVEVALWNGAGWGAKLGASAGIGLASDVELATLFAYVIVAWALPSGGVASNFASSHDNGATWSIFSTGLPVMPAGSTWSLKSNGSSVLAIPSFATTLGPATTVWKTVDGFTWTVAATLAFLGATDQVVGLAWNPYGKVWTLAIQTTVPGVKFATSPDGITWTVLATPPAAALSIADMASVGGALVCTLFEAVPGLDSGMIWSVDGGATWYPGQATLFLSALAATPGYTRPRIVSSGQGFLAWNNNGARFSALSGLPAVSL